MSQWTLLSGLPDSSSVSAIFLLLDTTLELTDEGQSVCSRDCFAFSTVFVAEAVAVCVKLELPPFKGGEVLLMLTARFLTTFSASSTDASGFSAFFDDMHCLILEWLCSDPHITLAETREVSLISMPCPFSEDIIVVSTIFSSISVGLMSVPSVSGFTNIPVKVDPTSCDDSLDAWQRSSVIVNELPLLLALTDFSGALYDEDFEGDVQCQVEPSA